MVQVGGTRIHYQMWDTNPTFPKPGLLLIHGHAAHSHWWDFIAPRFMDRYRVVAMDTSGSGESDHRSVYQMRDFSDEVLAVIRHAELRHSTIVGHSFGGAIGRVAAFIDGQRPDPVIAGLICVDTSISRTTRSANRDHSRNNVRGRTRDPEIKPVKQRFYRDLDEGARRFRLRPPQPCANGYLLDYIARYSLRKTEKGYCFKLDQRLFEKMPGGEALPPPVDMLTALTCPVGYVYGELSRFFAKAEQLSLLTELIPPERAHRIPGAYHHVFLDQPLAFSDALSSLIEGLA